MTRASTSPRTLGGTAAGLGKSKRSRPGEFSEPIWVAVSPSASRNALCTMCVAVWARLIASRRSRSTTAWACCPSWTSPFSTRARWIDRPGERRLDVEDLEDGAVVELDAPGVAELAAALGIERGAVEDELDLLALARRGRPARRRRRARRRWRRRSSAHSRGTWSGRRGRRHCGRPRRPRARSSWRRRRPWPGCAARSSAGGSRPRRRQSPPRPPSRGSGRSGSRRCRAAGTPRRRGLRVSAAWPAPLTRRVAKCCSPGPERVPEGLLLGVGERGDALPLGLELGVGQPSSGPCSPGGARAGPARRRRAAACCGRHVRSRRRSTYPRPSLPGVTPSPVSIRPVRTWSATTRSRTSSSWSRAVRLAGQLDRPVEDGADLVDLVEVVDALEDAGEPLEAEPGVDVLRRQRARGRRSPPWYRTALSSSCMKTRFQNSMNRSSSTSGPPSGPYSGPRSR